MIGHHYSGLRSFKSDHERFLKPEELPVFFDAVLALNNTTNRDMILMLLFTGQRTVNVFGMKWKDIDLVNGTWNVDGDELKNKNSAIFPLSDQAINLLKARKQHRKSDQWVFPSRMTDNYIKRIPYSWELVRKATGYHDLTLHDLRRTFGSWQAINGSSLSVIGRSLGHTSSSSTQIYSRLTLEPVRKSVNQAVNAIISSSGNKSLFSSK